MIHRNQGGRESPRVCSLATATVDRVISGFMACWRFWRCAGVVVLILIVLYVVVSVFGRDRSPSDGEPSVLVLYDPPMPRCFDWVFIHGAGGNGFGSWTRSDASEPWPKTSLPKLFPCARILSLNYKAELHNIRKGNPLLIEEHAHNLLQSLYVAGVNGSLPLFIGAHSMGGLLGIEILLLSDRLRNHNSSKTFASNLGPATKGIVFYGVPFIGSISANFNPFNPFTWYVSDYVKDLSVLEEKSFERMDALTALREKNPFPVFCVAEGRETYIFVDTIVKPVSATFACRGHRFPSVKTIFDATHEEVNKIQKAEEMFIHWALPLLTEGIVSASVSVSV